MELPLAKYALVLLQLLVERPPRRFDQDEDTTCTRWSPALRTQVNLEESDRTYRLDVALGRLEFSLHPLMSREHQLVISRALANLHIR